MKDYSPQERFLALCLLLRAPHTSITMAAFKIIPKWLTLLIIQRELDLQAEFIDREINSLGKLIGQKLRYAGCLIMIFSIHVPRTLQMSKSDCTAEPWEATMSCAIL